MKTLLSGVDFDHHYLVAENFYMNVSWGKNAKFRTIKTEHIFLPCFSRSTVVKAGTILKLFNGAYAAHVCT